MLLKRAGIYTPAKKVLCSLPTAPYAHYYTGQSYVNRARKRLFSLPIFNLSLVPNHPLTNLLSKLTNLGAHKQGWRPLSRLGAPLRPLLYSPGQTSLTTVAGVSSSPAPLVAIMPKTLL